MKRHQIVLSGFIVSLALTAAFSQPQPLAPEVLETQLGANLNKEKISLQFHLSEGGGAIDIGSKDPRDVLTRDSIRAYGKALAEQIGKGEFALLFTILPPNPEFVERVRKNGGVGFAVEEEPSGIRLDMGASSQQSRTAIHEFIRCVGGGAVGPHDRTIDHPGNNLGWDAPPAPDLKK